MSSLPDFDRLLRALGTTLSVLLLNISGRNTDETGKPHTRRLLRRIHRELIETAVRTSIIHIAKSLRSPQSRQTTQVVQPNQRARPYP